MARWEPEMQPLTAENWRQEVTAHEVAVMFLWAEWSPQDLALGKMLRQIRPEFASVAFFSCDMDAEPEVPQVLGVLTNPALICFLNGERHDTSIGHISARQLRAKLRQWLSTSTSGVP